MSTVRYLTACYRFCSSLRYSCSSCSFLILRADLKGPPPSRELFWFLFRGPAHRVLTGANGEQRSAGPVLLPPLPGRGAEFRSPQPQTATELSPGRASARRPAGGRLRRRSPVAVQRAKCACVLQKGGRRGRVFGGAHYLAGRRGGLSPGSGARAGEGEAPNVAGERRAKQRRRRRGPSETRGAAATAADELSGLAGPAGATKPLQHWHPRRSRPPSGHPTPARVEEVAAAKEARAAGESGSGEGTGGEGGAAAAAAPPLARPVSTGHSRRESLWGRRRRRSLSLLPSPPLPWGWRYLLFIHGGPALLLPPFSLCFSPRKLLPERGEARGEPSNLVGGGGRPAPSNCSSFGGRGQALPILLSAPFQALAPSKDCA